MNLLLTSTTNGLRSTIPQPIFESAELTKHGHNTVNTLQDRMILRKTSMVTY